MAEILLIIIGAIFGIMILGIIYMIFFNNDNK